MFKKSKLLKLNKLLQKHKLEELELKEIMLRGHQLKMLEMFLDLKSLQLIELKLKRKIEVVMIVMMLDLLQEEEAAKVQAEVEAVVIEEEDKLVMEIEMLKLPE